MNRLIPNKIPHLISLSATMVFSSLSHGSQPDAKENMRPNVVLICADDLGWSDIGCYGSEIKTPNLDQLAGEGVRFRQFHSAARCNPSRACLLTGVYAQDCGYDKDYRNPIKNAVTIGEVLRSAGYRTLWSGKHHGSENPITRGFDRYYGLKDGACNYFNPGKQRPGEPVPAQKEKQREWCIDSVSYKPFSPPQNDFYTTDYFTNYALNWLEEYKNEQKPFFLYVAYNAPHDPLMAWPSDIEKYHGVYDCGYETIRKNRYARQLKTGIVGKEYILPKPTFKAWESLSSAEKTEEARKMEVYAAMIDRMDQNIGRIIDKLKETGKYGNTIVIFVSDNGANNLVVNLDDDDDTAPIGSMERWSSLGQNWANVSNTPFRYFKNYSYQGGINSPCIVRWPGIVKSGSFSDFPGHFIDFMATLVDITGAEYPQEFRGQHIVPLRGESLLPVFKGVKTEREKPLFWELGQGRAARKGDWKIVKHGFSNNWSLYNMKNDPTETNDLSQVERMIVTDLNLLFERWKAEQPKDQQ